MDQNQYEEQITKMHELLMKQEMCLNILICLTLTGELRNKFTEINIHRMEALRIVKEEITK